MSVSARLIHRALWQRRRVFPDGSGGQIVEWAPMGTIRCRRSQPGSGRGGFGGSGEQTVAGQAEVKVTGVVHMEPDSKVLEGDRLILEDDVLEVTAVVRPSLPYYSRAECASIRREETIDGTASTP